MGRTEFADLERGAHVKEKAKSAAEKMKDADQSSIPWSEMSGGQQMKTVSWVLVRIVLLLACLYIFICSLGLLEDSFQLLGGRAAGRTFRNSDLLKNPIAGLMIGVLATVLVQSSSTSTSIVITMVGSEIIPLRSAIPIIMGANIGTSVTNTLVSLAQASDRQEFRRAFSGATVHDMFNWISVLVLLPLEVAVHYLEWLTGLIVDSMHLQSRGKAPDMLKAITKPLTHLVVEVDKKIIEKTASENSTGDGTVLKRWCEVVDDVVNVTRHNHVSNVTVDCRAILTSSSSPDASVAPPLLRTCREASRHAFVDLSKVTLDITFDTTDQIVQERKLARCDNLFAQSDLADSAAGGILLLCSLLVIFLALFGLVKILHSVLHGHLARVIKRHVNADLPGRAAYLTGYLFVLVGCGVTMVLQSSSVFTSTLTPMVGVGVVTLDRMYPLTLGANIGTTLTGILAALSQEGGHLENALHVALCHLFFNVSGILLFYPVPALRLPIGMAEALGRTTAKHRWFAVAYLLVLFVVLPGAVFGLSLAGWVYLGAVGGPLLLLFLLVVALNVVQRRKPGVLPPRLRSWEFLPLWMHSLKPVDSLISRLCRCGCCQRLQQADLGDARSSDNDDEEEDEEDRRKKEEEEEEGVKEEGRRGRTGADVEQPRDVTVKEVKAATLNGDAGHAYENGAFNMEEHRL